MHLFHVLLYAIYMQCVLIHFVFFVTPWTVARQAPLSTGFSQQDYWSGLPCPSPGDLPNQGMKPGSPALQVDSSLLSHWGNYVIYTICNIWHISILYLNSVSIDTKHKCSIKI